MATWYGMIKCASAEISRPLVSTPCSSRPASSVEQHAGVDDDTVADDVGHAGREDAGRDQVQGEVLTVGQHDGVAGVVAALVADDPLDTLTEQVGGLALALIAPLGTDQHDGRHVKLQAVGLVRANAGTARVDQEMTVRGIVLACGNTQLPMITDRDDCAGASPARRPARTRSTPIWTPNVSSSSAPTPTSPPWCCGCCARNGSADVPLGYVPSAIRLRGRRAVGPADRPRPRAGPRPVR